MHSDTDDCVAIDVDVPDALLAEIDAYAATHGYASPDAVVSEALDRIE
jgi:metal-responsive CopG/Arc/MetJ family transcriptional regulator